MKGLLVILSGMLLVSCYEGTQKADDASEGEMQDEEMSQSDVQECTSDSECRDDNPCNGDETCDSGTGTCVAGLPLETGFVCHSEPRHICLGGECVRSICGDGYTDTGAGEACDPPDDETCGTDCRIMCERDRECDDSDPCTEDVCDNGTCKHATYRDGVVCGGGRVCCGGECLGCCSDSNCPGAAPFCCDNVCLGCCDDADCDDAEECTQETCSDDECVYEMLPDYELCTDGICCDGQCRRGGECCVDADCDGGCSGMARPCSFFDPVECTEQIGCREVLPHEFCTGTPTPCSRFGELECGMCFCMWEPALGCIEDPIGRECEMFFGPECMDCGCTWLGDEPCRGDHGPCETYLDELTCLTQLDCSWIGCYDYQCTAP